MASDSAYYLELVRPAWAPPEWLFGPVWTVLYVVMAISYGAVAYKAATRELPARVLLPFLLNILFNVLFTWIQFGLRNDVLAFVDVVLVLGTLIWAMRSIKKRMPWVAYVNAPHLLWVSFATALQGTIAWMNR